MVKKVLVIHGPNLNLLGEREGEIYGEKTLKEINKAIEEFAHQLEMEVKIFQSNHEGEIIELIQREGKNSDALIINPAAFTHTSIGIRDAILAVGIPTIEVHLSNIFSRENFRHRSFISDIARGVISGFGYQGYLLALQVLKEER